MGMQSRRAMRGSLLCSIALLAAAGWGPVSASAADAGPKVTLLMASTIGPVDAGIVPALEEAYFARTGVLVRHVGAGTGAALEMAKRGGFDLVLVHARALEDQFIAQGFGLDRRDIMYNDFVLLGPATDPARIRDERSAVAALRRIAQTQALFVTRGDQSGTQLIRAFGVAQYGEPLFFPNSAPWHQRKAK